MSTEIPQWAYERVSRLQDDFSGASYYVSLSASYADLKGAFALYISQHEEPPVDPLLIEAREIAISESYGGRARWAEAWREKIMRGDDDREDRVKVALAALKRGIELGKSTA